MLRKWMVSFWNFKTPAASATPAHRPYHCGKAPGAQGARTYVAPRGPTPSRPSPKGEAPSRLLPVSLWSGGSSSDPLYNNILSKTRIHGFKSDPFQSRTGLPSGATALPEPQGQGGPAPNTFRKHPGVGGAYITGR